MKQRIEYIDAVKGFAIYLVVLGHVVGWQFTNFQGYNMGGVNLLWQIIYSFHMPLFMFLSGLFFPSYKEIKIKDIPRIIWMRFLTLMVPYFCMGLVFHVLLDKSFFVYWFLITLFLFFLLNTLTKVTLRSLKLESPLYEGIAYLFLSVFIFVLNLKVSFTYQGVGIIGLSVYPYFCLGIILSRYNCIDILLGKKWLYTLSIPLFVVSFYFSIYYEEILPLFKLLFGYIRALTGIYISLFIFKNFKQGKFFEYFRCLGTYSLEIYLLHVFFLVNLPILGEFYIEQHACFGFRGSFVPLFVVSIVISVINILLCFAIKNIIGHSNTLSMLLLGRKQINNIN